MRIIKIEKTDEENIFRVTTKCGFSKPKTARYQVDKGYFYKIERWNHVIIKEDGDILEYDDPIVDALNKELRKF